MKIGMIGLGRMGYNMSLRLLKNGHKVIGYNRNSSVTKKLAHQGGIAAFSLDEFVNSLGKRKIVWLMLPAGKVTEAVMKKVLKLLSKGDIIINGVGIATNTYETKMIPADAEVFATGSVKGNVNFTTHLL